MKKTLTEKETIDIFSEIAEMTAKLGWEVLLVSHSDGATPGILLGTKDFVEETSQLFDNHSEYELESWEFQAISGNEELH